jgi:hypothetical protein
VRRARGVQTTGFAYNQAAGIAKEQRKGMNVHILLAGVAEPNLKSRELTATSAST